MCVCVCVYHCVRANGGCVCVISCISKNNAAQIMLFLSSGNYSFSGLFSILMITDSALRQLKSQ